MENMCEFAKNIIELNKKLNNLKHNNEARARIVEDIHDEEYTINELLLTSIAKPNRNDRV